MSITRVPAIEGWFTEDPEPALIGTRCSGSGTYFFPPERVMSRAPGFADADLEEVRLSRRGRVWSYTDANYQPPEPYVPPGGAHEPFCIAAVELEAEGIVVLGQVVGGVTVEQLAVGMEMELVIDELYRDGDTAYTIFKWRPVEGSTNASTAGES